MFDCDQQPSNEIAAGVWERLLESAPEPRQRGATFYEFFAGGGMARAGLGPEWECLFANDIDPKKAACYAANWVDDRLCIGDVSTLKTSDLPGRADLAWASFPCQDLSLAGGGAGLGGDRSGAFWHFWNLMKALRKEGRGPSMIVLENVCGALSSHGGEDFAAIGSALAAAGYRFGAVIVDAAHFLPQSRPRLFVIGVQQSLPLPRDLTSRTSVEPWHPKAMQKAQAKLSELAKASWVWWRLPPPPRRGSSFADLVEDEPTGVRWHSEADTARLLAMMSRVNLAKVEAAKTAGRRMVGTIYRRTRVDDGGKKVQRAEVRFDDVAGCLRTPAGGSSRQTIIVVEGELLRSRLLSPREAARLMGLPDAYSLPNNYNEAYHLAGDGVAVPVVRFLSEKLLSPILAAAAPIATSRRSGTIAGAQLRAPATSGR
jgi:DNA (cytosine-5)-methyltransferase 1